MADRKIVLKYEARETAGDFLTDSFQSLADTVTVALKGEAYATAVLTLISYDREGKETEIHGESVSCEALASGYEYSFDPISLAVYKNAVKFCFKAEGVRKIEELSITESIPEESAENAESLDNTVMGSDREPLVAVYGGDGEVTLVPRVPKKALFIGNSLVFGMGGYGMCSSAPDKDYFHYVTEHIREYEPECKFDKLYGSFYEHSENTEMFDNWYYKDSGLKCTPPVSAESKFAEDLDLVFIQLGDNVNTDEKEASFRLTVNTFIERIKAASPRARIIWIHGWYNKKRTEDVIKSVCEKWKLERIDISGLRSKENEAHDQQYYYNIAEGKLCEVKPTWITHPGDLGMRKIADKIIAKLKLE